MCCRFHVDSNQALPGHARKIKREGESPVHFDHVLDVVGRGLPFEVDFAHALARSAGADMTGSSASVRATAKVA